MYNVDSGIFAEKLKIEFDRERAVTMKKSMMILLLCVVMCIGMLTGCNEEKNTDMIVDYLFAETLGYTKNNDELHMLFNIYKSPHDIMILRDELGDIQWCRFFGNENNDTIYLYLTPYLTPRTLYACNRDGSNLMEIITETEGVCEFNTGLLDWKQCGKAFFFVMYDCNSHSYDLYMCIGRESRLIAANICDYFPSPSEKGVYVVYDRKEFYECKYIEIDEELLDTEKSVDSVSVSENFEVMKYYINDGGNSLVMLGRDDNKYAIPVHFEIL